MMKIIHLFLKHIYFDLINEGQKLIEYRRNIPYDSTRLNNAKKVIFHRGYSSVTMTFKIKSTAVANNTIEIHFRRKM